MWNGLNINCKLIAKHFDVHLGLRVNVDFLKIVTTVSKKVNKLTLLMIVSLGYSK